MPKYVPGTGSLTAKLVIVGEAPGKNEDEQGKPFVGASGDLLNDFLSKAGISRSEVYITNVVKYRPPLNDFTKLHLIDVDLEKSIESLWNDEIRKIRPNCILAVGDVALQALTGNKGILNYRGSILRSRDGDFKVVAMVHPAALFSKKTYSDKDDENNDYKGGLSYAYTKLMQSDVNRAVEESRYPDFRLPERTLTVIENSLQLHRFRSEYDKLDKAATDIESINCIPVCIGFAFNRHHAISVPLLRRIGNWQLTGMGDKEIVECWRMIYEMLQRLKLIGHNLKYDDFKMGLLAMSMKNVYSDTLIKTRVLFPECPDKKLLTVSSLWTREPYYKDEGKEFKLGKSNINQLFLYNAKDCAVEFEVDEEQEQDLIEMQEQYRVPLVDYYYNYMMKKHKFYLNMENNGFNVDHTRQAVLKAKYTEMENVVHAKLIAEIGHELNVKSYPQMFQLLYKEMKFKLRTQNPTSEDVLVALLGQTKKAEFKTILSDILEERRIRDQKSRYINFSPDYDGRCKTSFNIIATETCRSSTSVLKKPIRPKKIGLAFHTISKHGRLAKDIRSMFIPDKGKIFIQADSSQAEARVVAVLACDWELLDKFDKVDIHRRTAGLIYGYTPILNLGINPVPVVDLLEKDGPERFTGKMVRHAGNYNMGKRRFMTEFNTNAQKFEINMAISEWRAGQMLDLFHAASPKIRDVFHTEIKAALDASRVLIDPFGGVRVFCGRWDEELYKEGFANIPQRTVAHLVQKAALATEEELNGDIKHMWISENHDSLLMQVPENNWMPYALLLRKHMQAPIDFSQYCTLKRNYILTIPCDVELSDTNYSELRKVKLDATN